ncbi:DUF2953 domain-containing protein [Paenibacillus sp. NPDC058071]|uniref:DUF2953 domain-containing protein n=1 Tax=Paenibacillus sp. NPDC058071 TaxID=3346326 RepID=UPI0036DDF87C
MPGYVYGWLVTAAVVGMTLIVLALLSPVRIRFHTFKAGSDDDVTIELKALYGLLVYSLQIPSVKFYGGLMHLQGTVSGSTAGMDVSSEKKDDIGWDKISKLVDKMKQIIQITRHLPDWVKQTAKRIQLKELSLQIKIGTGDAMWTAMATGLVWSLLTTFFGLVSQYVHVKREPAFTIAPDYKQVSFAAECLCIVQIRLVYAIFAGLHLLARAKKGKGGVKAWQNILSKA